MSTTEFPRDLIPLLRCSRDRNELNVSVLRSGAFGVIDARMLCTECGFVYRIEDGIAHMLVEDNLTAEDRHEISIRDCEYASTHGKPFVAPAASWRSELSDLLEIPPHLQALGQMKRCRVLELGCGDGRCTMLMAQLGAQILAVDFSINALRRMAAWLPSGVAPTNYRLANPSTSGDLRGCIGLVQACASHFHVAPKTFDRTLSATPLDSREQRMAMYRTIADGLKDGGRYVGSFEHDDLMRRLLGLPLGRRYEQGGIFIEHFSAETLKREFAPFFFQLRTQCIRPRMPFVSLLPNSLNVFLSVWISRIPGLRNFGEIVLVIANKPIRSPLEVANRSGNRLLKAVFRSYTRQLGKEPVWGTDELVS